jgi:rhamnosyltransferase
MPAVPEASVVIPTKDAGPGFRETLEVILLQSFPGSFEVLVIDSGSQDGTVELCRRFPVQLIQIPPASFGHGTTRNQAVTQAQGRFIAMTVQDAVPADSSWLEALVQPMIDDPQVAGVYGRQVPRPGASYLARQRNRLWYGAQESRLNQELDGVEQWQALSFEARRALTRFDNVTSCLRRSAWQEIPFPPYGYAEDVGWARHTLEAGYKLVYEPAARVYHSHDRDLAHDFQRGYIDARNLARILDAPLNPLTPTEARKLLGWLGKQAKAYLEALEEPHEPPSSFGQALSQADAHWTLLGTGEMQGQLLEAPSLDSALLDEASLLERFDTAAARRLFGPDSPYPADERAWLLEEIGWLQAEAAEERALYESVFDREAAHYLLGSDSPRAARDRAWLAGKLQLWAEDEVEARARYRASFDTECMAYLLGPRSVKGPDEQAWLAGQLDRLERERSRLGLPLGRRLSRRLVQPQPCEEDIGLAFGLLWDGISRDYAREAVNVLLFQTGRDPAHLFDRLWALGAPDLVKEAVARSLRARIEAALTGDRALSGPELRFIFRNLWGRLGAGYITGVVADLAPAGPHHSLVRELCAEAWLAGGLTHEIAWRARLYAAAAVTACRLGMAARAALVEEGSGPTRFPAAEVEPSGTPSAEPGSTTPFWQQVQALLDHPEGGRGFWASLDRTLAQRFDMNSGGKV